MIKKDKLGYRGGFWQTPRGMWTYFAYYTYFGVYGTLAIPSIKLILTNTVWGRKGLPKYATPGFGLSTLEIFDCKTLNLWLNNYRYNGNFVIRRCHDHHWQLFYQLHTISGKNSIGENICQPRFPSTTFQYV